MNRTGTERNSRATKRSSGCFSPALSLSLSTLSHSTQHTCTCVCVCEPNAISFEAVADEDELLSAVVAACDYLRNGQISKIKSVAALNLQFNSMKAKKKTGRKIT